MILCSGVRRENYIRFSKMSNKSLYSYATHEMLILELMIISSLIAYSFMSLIKIIIKRNYEWVIIWKLIFSLVSRSTHGTSHVALPRLSLSSRVVQCFRCFVLHVQIVKIFFVTQTWIFHDSSNFRVQI